MNGWPRPTLNPSEMINHLHSLPGELCFKRNYKKKPWFASLLLLLAITFILK